MATLEAVAGRRRGRCGRGSCEGDFAEGRSESVSTSSPQSRLAKGVFASRRARQASLREALGEAGLEVREIVADGNCLFRAAADQLLGSQGKHRTVRAAAVEEMRRRRSSFECFFDKDEDGGFDEYADRMERDGVWGGQLELQAISLAFSANIVVYQADEQDLGSGAARFGRKKKGASAARGDGVSGETVKAWIMQNFPEESLCLLLAFHPDSQHYNSVRLRGAAPNAPSSCSLKALAGEGGSSFNSPSSNAASPEEAPPRQTSGASFAGELSGESTKPSLVRTSPIEPEEALTPANSKAFPGSVSAGEQLRRVVEKKLAERRRRRHGLRSRVSRAFFSAVEFRLSGNSDFETEKDSLRRRSDLGVFSDEEAEAPEAKEEERKQRIHILPQRASAATSAADGAPTAGVCADSGTSLTAVFLPRVGERRTSSAPPGLPLRVRLWFCSAKEVQEESQDGGEKVPGVVAEGLSSQTDSSPSRVREGFGKEDSGARCERPSGRVSKKEKAQMKKAKRLQRWVWQTTPVAGFAVVV